MKTLIALLAATLLMTPSVAIGKPCGNGYIEDSDTCHIGSGGGDAGEVDGVLVIGVMVGIAAVTGLIYLIVTQSKGEMDSLVQTPPPLDLQVTPNGGNLSFSWSF